MSVWRRVFLQANNLVQLFLNSGLTAFIVKFFLSCDGLQMISLEELCGRIVDTSS